MARWDVRFQLQTGRGEVDSKNYSSNAGPCTEKEALQRLAALWASNRTYYRSSTWNNEFRAAIEKAERAVKNARNASAGENRNFYSTTFNHDGTTYRVDIAIEAGEGHFN